MITLEKINEMVQSGEIILDMDNFEPTDSQGYSMEGIVYYYGPQHIDLAFMSELSYEEQTASQIYGYIQEGKLWLDDIREAPYGYLWCKSVNEAKTYITKHGMPKLIDFDHDAGDYADDGGDYIKLMDWMEENRYSCNIRIHSKNPVGVKNMQDIARKNGWNLLP